MAELKTKRNSASVEKFLNGVKDVQKRADCFEVLKLMEEVTGAPGKMWGTSIVGFGLYRYKYARSGREGDWPLVGFSPRVQNITFYIMPDFEGYADLREKLGKHSTGKYCLYIKRLEQVDKKVLKKLVKQSVAHIKKNNPEI